MLGLTDWGVAAAYLLSLGATVFCVIIALRSGNKIGQE